MINVFLEPMQTSLWEKIYTEQVLSKELRLIR